MYTVRQQKYSERSESLDGRKCLFSVNEKKSSDFLKVEKRKTFGPEEEVSLVSKIKTQF